MSNFKNLTLEDLFKLSNLTKDSSRSVRQLNNELSALKSKNQDIFSNLGASFISFNNFFTVLNSNLKETQENLKSVSNQPLNSSLEISLNGLNNLFIILKSNLNEIHENLEKINSRPLKSSISAGGLQTDSEGKTGDPGLTPEQRKAIIIAMQNLEARRNKDYLNLLIDTGIITADFATDGIAGTPLTLVKNHFQNAPDAKETPEGVIRPSTDSEGPKWSTESEREGWKKIVEQISNEQAKQIITQSTGITIPIYDNFQERKENESPGRVMMEESWMHAMEHAGVNTSWKGAIDYAKTLFDDMYSINFNENLIGKYQSLLTQDDILKKQYEKNKPTEQKLEEAWPPFRDSMKNRPEPEKDWRERQSTKQSQTPSNKNENIGAGYSGGQFENGKSGGSPKEKNAPNPLNTFKNIFGEVQKVGGALKTLMSTLHIGADTFVGKVITGFTDALGVIQSIMDVLEAAQTIGSFLKIIGLADGGRVPGTGDYDSVPAMLTPGEFVVKKSVVNKLGAGFFEHINGGRISGSLLGHYANGGLVSSHQQLLALAQNINPMPAFTNTIREPYIVSTSVRGTDLKLTLQRTEQRISRERS